MPIKLGGGANAIAESRLSSVKASKICGRPLRRIFDSLPCNLSLSVFFKILVMRKINNSFKIIVLMRSSSTFYFNLQDPEEEDGPSLKNGTCELKLLCCYLLPLQGLQKAP